MRKGWLAVPLLAASTACTPIREYEQAAHSLAFHLERVEPRLHLALPLDRSSITFRIVLGVDNPSRVAFHVLGFTGDMTLEAGGSPFNLGHVELARPLDLAPASSGHLEAEVTFPYEGLRDHWDRIEAAVHGSQGAWNLQGSLRTEAFGLPITLPVRTRRAFGGSA